MSTDNTSCHKPNSVNPVNSFSTFSVLYYNARSLLPKLDNLAAVCVTCNPDIVCIVESWLSDDIQDNEMSLPNYSVVRLDRNRHGGGIVMYIKNTFTYSIVLLGPSDLELCKYYII